MSVYNIEDFGALKNSGMLATEAISRAIEAASEAGGGTVYVPAGTYFTGAIVMKSNIELNLNPGSDPFIQYESGELPCGGMQMGRGEAAGSYALYSWQRFSQYIDYRKRNY